MNEVDQVTAVARSISDYGALIVVAGAFIVLSILMWVAIFRWFQSIINKIIDRSNSEIAKLLEVTEKQNDMLTDISEGMRHETQIRLRNLTGMAFDLAVEQVCRLIKRIREENHIVDRAGTREKIRRQVRIIHDDRNSRFDHFTYRGRPISAFCDDNWVEQVSAVVETELYHEQGANNKRAYTNVKMAYDDIKLDFYHRMNG